MKFDGDDYFIPNTASTPWAADVAAREAYWQRAMKSAALELRLQGMNNEEIVKRLTQRYRSMLRKLEQNKDSTFTALYFTTLAQRFDAHAAYFPPRPVLDIHTNMQLRLEGIGGILSSEDGYVRVNRLVPGSPAAKEGTLKPGDRIVAIGEATGDMKDVIDVSLDEAVDLIRGPRNSAVRLEVLPAEAGLGGAHKIVTIVRDRTELEQQGVTHSMLELSQNGRTSRIGVISVPTLYLDQDAASKGEKDYASATHGVQKSLAELAALHVDGIVLDLRENSGGVLTEAADLPGLFIDSGPTLLMHTAAGKVVANGKKEGAAAYNGPLLVLINRLTAAGAEMVAATLQDYQRALVVGDTSYGRGSAQQIYALASGELKLTNGKMYRISGESIEPGGVVPDIALPTIYDLDGSDKDAGKGAAPSMIAAPSHRTYFALAPALPMLQARHRERASQDPVFKQLEAVQRQPKAELRLSLNEATRRRQMAEEPKVPTVPASREAMLQEAARILIDALPAFGVNR
jgi:carboxyl-terminal processing protease